MTHLGHVLNKNFTDSNDITAQKGAFIGRVNFVLANFKCLISKHQYRIFQSYCSSYYGSQLWKLDAKQLDTLCTSYNIALRKIFRLPYKTHRHIVYYLTGKSSLYDQFVDRSIHFLESCRQCKNLVVQTLLRVNICNSKSILGYNTITARLRNSSLSGDSGSTEKADVGNL